MEIHKYTYKITEQFYLIYLIFKDVEIHECKVVYVGFILKFAFFYFARWTPCGFQPLHPAKTVENPRNYNRKLITKSGRL